MWRNKFSISIIICFAFIIRLISLNQSLWHDESINVLYARMTDFWTYVFRYPIGDFHPNGYFAILWIWGHIFGFSEVSVRMPSVIFGVLTVLLVYFTGKKFFTKEIGLLAAFLLLIAPLHIYYSQEARMYSFAAFAVTFSFYWLMNLVKKKRFSFLGYSLGIALVLYSDYVTYLVLFPQLFYILLFERKLLKQLLLAFFTGTLLALPSLIILPSQLAYGIALAERLEGWKNAVGAATLKNYLLLPVKILIGRISIDNNTVYVGVISITSLPYLILLLKKQFRFNKDNSWLWFWLVFPIILAIIISPVIPIFSYFRLLFILPAFYLLIAITIVQFFGKWRKIVLGIIIITQIISSAVYLFDTDFHREDWKGSIKFIESSAQINSIILFENDELFTGYRYYSSGQIPAYAAFSYIPVKSEVDLVDLNSILRNKKQVFLYEYLIDVTDPNRILEKKLSMLGYTQKASYNFRGVGLVRLYIKL